MNKATGRVLPPIFLGSFTHHRKPALLPVRCVTLLCAWLMAACQQLPQVGPLQTPGGLAIAPQTSPEEASKTRDSSTGAAPVWPASAPVWGPTLWDGLESPDPPLEGVARASPAGAPPQDLWIRLRRGLRLPEPGGAAGQRVTRHEQWYRQNGVHMTRTFTRARLYLHDIVQAVEGQGMPLEIALLPAVESAFIPEARSHAAAEGLWQFIAPTARRFKLNQHHFQDDRRAIRAATQAALRYLQELQLRYGGDYQLALAAYNCGEGCIDRAIRRAKARGLPGRFEDLQLNDETANYVPRLLGLARVVAQAVDSGDLAAAGLPPMADAPYFVAVAISRDIDVKLAAQLAGLSDAKFFALNPQHRRPVIVAEASAEVLVPIGRKAYFLEALANYRGPMATWTATRTSKRSSVESLAAQHGTTPQVLRQVNQIPPGRLVGAGSTLVVPRMHVAEDIPGTLAATSMLITVPAMVMRRVQVQRKDTWHSLAARLSVGPAELKRWNPHVRTLRQGQLGLALPIAVAEQLGKKPRVGDASPRRGRS